MARKKAPNRRGSPEAVAKRRAGRAFNDLFDQTSQRSLDGRTAKRRQRLLAELSRGKKRGSGRNLKPLDVLGHVSELLELGEPLAKVKKACKPLPPPDGDEQPVVEVVRKLHDAYGFRPEAYRFVGIGDDVLREAGVLPARGRRQPKPS